MLQVLTRLTLSPLLTLEGARPMSHSLLLILLKLWLRMRLLILPRLLALLTLLTDIIRFVLLP